jgi:hypothetical protein
VSAAAEHEPAAESVAFLALAYRQLSTQDSSVGPRLTGDEWLDDVEAEDEKRSFLTMAAGEALAPVDWQVIRWLQSPEAVAWGEDVGLGPDDFELPDLDALRAEALLHALAAGTRPGQLDELGELPAVFVLRVAERWGEVEDEIDRWRGLGITATREDAHDIYIHGLVKATGRSFEEIIDEQLDAVDG